MSFRSELATSSSLGSYSSSSFSSSSSSAMSSVSNLTRSEPLFIDGCGYLQRNEFGQRVPGLSFSKKSNGLKSIKRHQNQFHGNALQTSANNDKTIKDV